MLWFVCGGGRGLRAAARATAEHTLPRAALDVKRRVKVLTAADELAHTLYEEDEE